MVNLKQGEVTSAVNHLSKDEIYHYDEMNNLKDEYGRIDETRTSHVSHTYDKKGNKIQYDYAGNIMKRQSLNNSGNYDTSTYVYDYRNNLIEEKLPYLNNESIKTIKYDYDRMGNRLAKTRIVKGVAETVSYRYDGLGRKLMETDPLGNSTRYKYDANGNVIKKVDPRYIHLPIDQAPGMEFAYDALNRLIKTVAFDGSNREVINYKEYDQRGNLTKNAEGEGYNAAQPDQSYGDVYVYDIFDQMITYISAQTYADNMKNGTQYHTRKYTYDSLGNVLSEEDGLGNKIQYVYYLNGKLKEKIYPDGYKESYDYDLTGEMMTVKTDRAGYVTRTFNTIFAKPYRIEYPDSSFETFVYSPKGELTGTHDQEGNAKYFGYDPSGNQIFRKEFIKEDSSYASYKLVKYGYDETDRLISTETFLYKEPKSGLETVTISAGDKVEFVYDKAGRKIKVSGPFGRETQYEYDRAGNLLTQMQKVNDGEYDVKRFTYNFRSPLVSEALLVKTSDVEIQYLAGANFDQTYYDRVLATTSYGYNKNGKIVSKKDPYGNITRFDYDLDNRLTKKTDPLQATTTYRYDLNDNLLEEINAKGVSTYYEYDNLNRLIRKKTPAADGGVAITRYIYDVLGNLIKSISPEDYDPEKDVPPLAGAMLGIAYTYDRMNRRVSTISPDGKVMEYVVYDKNGRVRKVIDGLRFTGDITTSKGTVYEYDGLGQVVKQTDALGYSTIFEYDLLGNLTKRVDAKGNITVQNFNPDNTLRSITFADGGTVSYTYDKLGRKTGETNQLGNTTSFTYNVFGKLKEVRDPYNYTIVYKYDLNGNLVSYKDKRGSVTLFKYDANNRLVEKKIPLELDGSSNIVYAVESYVYDELGNLLRKSVSGSKDASFKREVSYTYYDNNLLQSETNNGGLYIRYEYDKNGNRTKLEKLRDVDVYDIELFEYDKLNRMVKHIRLADEEDVYQSGFTNLENLRDSDYPGKIRMITGYEYDVLGNKTKEIDPRAYLYGPEETVNREKYTVTFTYDELNRLDKVIRKHGDTDVYRQFTYDEVGNKITERNERGYVTHYDYDRINRLLSITDPLGNTFSYQYDLAGNKTIEQNAKGYTMSYGYDKLNRLDTIRDPYNVVIRKNVYDANGNIVKVIDAKGYLSANNDQDRYGTVFVYDLANRLVKMIDPEVAAVGGANAFTAKYEYNPVGQITKETDALGNTHIYEYDPAGNLVSVTDPLGVKTSYHYDKAGNKLYMLDGRGKITRYHYGSFGWLREVINADNKTIRYQYDLAGNITQKIDQKGYHTEYIYDNRNLLLSKEVKETGDSIRYSYDETGNRIAMTDESGNSTYSYDQRNLLLQINKDGVMQIRYTYDEIGNIETITDKSGATTGYTYDKSSRMETVTYNGTTTYLYDENGNRKAVIYPGGVSEEYSYDKNNRLLTLTNKKPDGSIISAYSYTYDLRGLQKTKTDEFGTTVYTYDEAGRIKKVDAPGKTTVYSYDNAGNRKSMMETYTSPQPSGFVEQTSQKQVQFKIKKSEYIYSNTNQLLKLVETMYDEAGVEVLEKTVDYLYDENGNEVSEKTSYISPHTIRMRQSTGANPHGEGVTGELNLLLEKVTNTYDGFNQLKTAVKIKGGERFTVSYVYNGDGLRTKKTVLSSKEGNMPKVTNYLYDRQHVILETDGSDRTLVRYVRGINYIARIDGSGKTSYFLYNVHGDVVQTVSASGEVENRYDYDIFGNPILTMEVYANSIRYAGEFFDTETGLYYLRARYYNPYIGRFISEDSYWGKDSNPLSLNLYTYVHNDPINFIDPTGHWKQGDEKLPPSEQRKIKQLTDAYNSTNDPNLKQEISKQADKIREEAKKRGDYGDYSDSFSKEANKIISQKGYITAEDWKALSEKHERRSEGESDSVKHRHDDGRTKSSRMIISEILTHAENNFDYRLGSVNWKNEVELTNKYYKNRKKKVDDALRRVALYKDYTLWNNYKIDEEDLELAESSAETMTLKMIMKDTMYNQKELRYIKSKFVNSLYQDKQFRTYYTTINKLVGVLNPEDEKQFTEEIHYFRNEIGKDIAPKTLDELIAMNKRLEEELDEDDIKVRWMILPEDQAAFHMYGEDEVFNTKFVLGEGKNYEEGQHFEAVYNRDGQLVTDPVNMGTYNFFGPNEKLKHYNFDVNPYYEWNNIKGLEGRGGRVENINAGKNLGKFYSNPKAQKHYNDIFKKANPDRYKQEHEIYCYC